MAEEQPTIQMDPTTRKGEENGGNGCEITEEEKGEDEQEMEGGEEEEEARLYTTVHTNGDEDDEEIADVDEMFDTLMDTTRNAAAAAADADAVVSDDEEELIQTTATAYTDDTTNASSAKSSPRIVRAARQQHKVEQQQQQDEINNDNNNNNASSSWVQHYVSIPLRQLLALIRKHWLVKMRTPVATFMEIASPVLLCLVLVLAYQLTEIKTYPAAVYDTVKIDVNPWVDLFTFVVNNAGNSNNNNTFTNGGGLSSSFTSPQFDNSGGRKRMLLEKQRTDFLRVLGEAKVIKKSDNEYKDLTGSGGDGEMGDLLLQGGLDGDGSSLLGDYHLSDDEPIWMKTFEWLSPRTLYHQQHPRTPPRPSKSALDTATKDRKLQQAAFSPGGGTTPNNGNDNTTSPVFSEAAVVLDEMRRQFQQFMSQPMMVPPLDMYVQLSTVMSSFLGTGEEDNDDDESGNPGDGGTPSFVTESQYGRQWGNLLRLGTLRVVIHNNNSSTTSSREDEKMQFSDFLNDQYPQALESLDVRLYDNTTQAIDEMKEDMYKGGRTWAIIELKRGYISDPDGSSKGDNSNNHGPHKNEFVIRMNYTSLPDTSDIVNYVALGLDTSYQQYYLSGYLTLQRTINEYVFSTTTSTTSNSNTTASTTTTTTTTYNNTCPAAAENIQSVWSMPMPTAAYQQNPFFLAVGFLMGLTIVMSMLYPTSRFVKSIVEEKESGMKELLLVLGVRPQIYGGSWYITHLFIFCLIAIFITLALTASILQYSSSALIFVWMFLFTTSTLSFAYMIASIFSKAKLAAVIAPIALFVTILPRFIFVDSSRNQQVAAKKWASLLPGSAFTFGADIVANYEYAQQGVQPYNASQGDYSFATSVGFLFLDTFIYLLLAFYLERVIPKPFGSTQPWYFCCWPPYWFRSSARQGDEVEPPVPGTDANENGYHEPVIDPALTAQVEFRNLVKQYKKQPVPAVNGLNLTLYESQITALLGHNGAGKSTTVSLVTGIITPTSGDCIVFGNSIVRQRTKARQSIGVCPQHNTLFDRLTVSEHLWLFQAIKGLRPTSDSIRTQADEIGLGDYLYTTSDSLSGGNKRKLCMAIALCGDPKLLVLDEPTSGMDPKSRRLIWDVLRNKRLGRVILLTTHFMDEAERLSDRVAVMKEGSLQCSGSPVYLKHRFGLGYNLTAVISDSSAEHKTSTGVGDSSAVVDVEAQSTEQCAHSQDDSSNQVLSFLKSYIPGAELTRRCGKEMTFCLPKGSENKFPDMFSALEEESTMLKIGAFGVENASLEEVFILLAEENESSSASLGDAKGTHNGPVEMILTVEDGAMPSEGATKRTGGLPEVEKKHLSSLQQVGLLFWKRTVIQRRDLKGAFFLIIVPVILVALVLLILTVNVSLAGPALVLTPELYSTSALNSYDDTDVVIGGGAAVTNLTMRSELLQSDFSQLRELLNNTYDNAASFQDALSSASISEYLLRTYNENIRFGGFVFSDILQVNVRANLTYVSSELFELFNFTAPESVLDGLGSVNATEIPDGAFNFSLTELIEEYIGSELNNFYELPTGLSILHNSSSPHAVAVFNQAYSEYMYQQCTGDRAARLVSVNYPLPITEDQAIEVRTLLSIFASLFILIPYCYISGAFTVFMVKERANKSKHIQLISGSSLTAYWFSSYLFDLACYFILTIGIMLVFLMYGSESAQVFVGDVQSFFCTMALTFGYGLSILPFSYLISLGFKNHSSAQIACVAVVFITGFVAVNAYFIMSSLEKTRDLAESLRVLFRFFPAYNVGDGLIQMATAFWGREILGSDTSPFAWDVAGKPLALLYGLAIPYFTAVLLFEFSNDSGSGGRVGGVIRAFGKGIQATVLRWCGVRKIGGQLLLNDGLADGGEDDDVKEERRYVSENLGALEQSAPVVYHNLWKVYPPSIGLFGVLFSKVKRLLSTVCCFPCKKCTSTSRAAEMEDKRKASLPKRAVRGVTTVVSEGETYALLGKNGAGKTSTLGVLTGDTSATSGDVYVAGYNVRGDEQNDVIEARKHTGFCPQVDPLLDLMTGRETLFMYARLRGIPKNKADEYVSVLLDRLTLTPHADKMSQLYSGGNKRKLSLGIALIGDPRVLIIDEPSTGLDPVAKRNGMWKIITDISQDRSVILTTHSMQEAEALCTRAGIMADGQLRCIGSVQHLKSKYLDGYSVDIVCHPESDVDLMIATVLPEFTSTAKVSEHHGRFVRMLLPNLSSNTRGIGSTFRTLQNMMSRTLENDGWQVENYSLSQSSLEQVFLQLTDHHSATTEQRLSDPRAEEDDVFIEC